MPQKKKSKSSVKRKTAKRPSRGKAPRAKKTVTKRKAPRAKKTAAKRKAKGTEHLKHSKSEGFLEKIRDNSMVEYFTRLRILNPAAQLISGLNEPRREGGFVRLAHAREEFTAPVITKGKSVESRKKQLSTREEE